MQDFIPWWIVENTLIAGCLAVVVMLVCRSRRVPPVIRHGLWLVVFVKLITPPLFSIDVPFLDEFVKLAIGLKSQAIRTLEPAGAAGGLPAGWPKLAESTTGFPETEDLGRLPELTETSLVESIERPVSGVQPFLEDQVAGVTFPRPAVPAFVNEDRPETDSNRAFTFTPQMLFWPGFLMTTIGVVFFQGIRLVRLRGLLKRSLAGPPDLDRLVAELSAEMRVPPPRVRLSAEIQSPVVCALGRATLVWPACGPTALGAAGRRAIVVHELAHLARRDHWIGWVELLAACAWWWNPLYWYVRHQLHENAELACDAWVAGICPQERRAYARALVDLAEFDSLKTAAAPAFGVGDGSRKLFERRLVMILGNRVRHRMGPLGMLSTVLLALVVLPGCSLGHASEDVALAMSDEPASTDPFTASEVSSRFADPALTPAVEPAARDLAPSSTGTDTRREIAPVGSAEALANQRPTAPASRELAAPLSPEDRLKRLEDRFDALLAELREARSGGRSTAAPATPLRETLDLAPQPSQNKGPNTTSPRAADANDGYTARVKQLWAQQSATASTSPPRKVKPGIDGRGEVETVALTRVTYKLPAGKAEALAAFLSANLSDDIEVRVKENSLQVTASAEDQGAIGHFMQLLAAHRTRADKRPPEESRPEADDRKPALPGSREKPGTNPAQGF